MVGLICHRIFYTLLNRLGSFFTSASCRGQRSGCWSIKFPAKSPAWQAATYHRNVACRRVNTKNSLVRWLGRRTSDNTPCVALSGIFQCLFSCNYCARLLQLIFLWGFQLKKHAWCNICHQSFLSLTSMMKPDSLCYDIYDDYSELFVTNNATICVGFITNNKWSIHPKIMSQSSRTFSSKTVASAKYTVCLAHTLPCKYKSEQMLSAH